MLPAKIKHTIEQAPDLDTNKRKPHENTQLGFGWYGVCIFSRKQSMIQNSEKYHQQNIASRELLLKVTTSNETAEKMIRIENEEDDDEEPVDNRQD